MGGMTKFLPDGGPPVPPGKNPVHKVIYNYTHRGSAYDVDYRNPERGNI